MYNYILRLVSEANLQLPSVEIAGIKVERNLRFFLQRLKKITWEENDRG